MTDQPVTTKRSYCRICTTQCGIVVDVAGDRIVKVRGDRAHPLTRGYTCPKGRSLGLLHHHVDAITAPMLRVDGALAAASWDAVLDDLAARLKAVVDEHGPGAVAFFFGSGLGMDAAGFRMAEAFHQALGGAPRFSPLTIDGTAKVLVSSMVGGFPGLNPKVDFDAVDMLLFVGTNPMVSHGHNNGMYNPAAPIRAAAARGEVWTIDPLFTETAKFSTRHLAPHPGTDYAILAWLVREVLDGGPLHPAQPVAGVDELRAALTGFDRATAAAIAGVDEQDLADLLAAIRARGRLTIETGTGVTMSRSANLTHWLSWVLMALTGTMNRPGGIWFHPGFLVQFDSFPLPLMVDPFTPGAPTMPDVRGIIGDWPCAALPGEIAAGNIRAMVNLGGSLLRSFPDANRLKPALEALDVCASFEIVANETTALSSHVLPTKDQTERPEITLWDTLGSRVSLQHTPALVDPIGDRRSAWWIVARLMTRMGLAVPDDLPQDDRLPGADAIMLERLVTPGARAPFAEVAATGYVERPLEFPAPWVDRHVENLGGWQLAPEPLVAMWHELRAADEAALGQPRPLQFISRRQRRKLNASLDFLGSPADILLHPDDAAAHGIADGDRVAVSTDRGAIELTANVDPAMRRGVASIPHGHAVANVNHLTSLAAVDRLGGQVRYTGIPIHIEAVA